MPTVDGDKEQQASPTGGGNGWRRVQTYAKQANDVSETVKHLKGIVLTVLALVPAGFNEFVLNLGAGIVASLLVTIPLTVAVALITYAILADDTPIVRVLLAIAVLIVGNLVGLATGPSGIAEAWSAAHANVLQFGVQLILGYGLTYGFAAYVAPLAIGIGAGWLWERSRY
jgi:hypothetical protein